MSRSRKRRREGGRVRKLTCWDGYKRRLGGQMTSCDIKRCRVGDEGCPGGWLNLCGSYVGD